MRAFFSDQQLKGEPFENALKERQAKCSDSFRFTTNKFFAFLQSEYPGISIRLENDLWNPYTKQRNIELVQRYFASIGKVPSPPQYCTYLNKCITELLVRPRYGSLEALATAISPRPDYTMTRFIFKLCLRFIKWLEANQKIARAHFVVETEKICSRIASHAREELPAQYEEKTTLNKP
jgi:hypothetical protein